MKYLVLILTVSLVACAGEDGRDGVNGQDGAQGAPGIDGKNPALPYATPVALLNPCGDAPNIPDEILILLAGGEVVVSYSDAANGNNTRLAVLPPGTYQTTDGDSCVFTIDAEGGITSESHTHASAN